MTASTAGLAFPLPAAAGRHALERPGDLAVADAAVRWTWADLDRRASAVGAGLARAGVLPGSPVALLADASAASAAFVHGIARAGGVLVPLGNLLTAPEIRDALDETGARLLVHDAGHAGLAVEVARAASSAEVARAARVARADGAARPVTLPLATLVEGGGVASAALLDVSRPAAIVLTSGTTGRPKGALLTHAALAASVAAWHAVLPRPIAGWLACLSLAHVAGLGMLWRAAATGVPLVVRPTFDPERLLEDLAREPVSHLSLVAVQLARLLDAAGDGPPPPRLRAVLLGGGPIPPGLVERAAAAGWPAMPTYGMTEMASGVTALPVAEARSRPGSAGRPLPGVEVRLAAADNPAVDAQPGEIGEILVRGPMRFAGYAGRPEETAAVLDADGWYRTGDLGALDADGYLWIADRRLDLIVSGGENVYPAEVEAVLGTHPAVAEAGVTGEPDPAWGAVPEALVVLRPDAPSPTVEELLAFCRVRLAPYKVPARIAFVGALPRSPGGKLLRRELAALRAGVGTGAGASAGARGRTRHAAPASGREARRVVRPDGASIAYRRIGEGPAILLLHATLSTAAQLARLARRLAAAGATVVSVDRRGSGESRLAEPRPVAVAVHVADALAVLDAEGLDGRDAPVVVGHSYGGVVALELAARAPGRVRGVVAYEPPYAALADVATRVAMRRLGAATIRAHRAGGAPAAAETFLRAVAGDGAFEALPERSRAFVLAEGDGALVDAALRGLDPNGLARIAVPVVVVTGGASEPFYRPIADALVARIPGARRMVLPGLRHTAPITEPGPIAELVQEALAALDRAGPPRPDRPPGREAPA